MAINVIHVGGIAVCLDAEAVLNAYGAHALKIDAIGNVEVLIAETDGAEWRSTEDAPLVQPAGKPTKARKQ